MTRAEAVLLAGCVIALFQSMARAEETHRPISQESPTRTEPAGTHAAGSPRNREESRHVGQDHGLADLLLVRSAAGKAVIRFGKGPLSVVAIGDRLGKSRAEVKEIEAGRMVLLETFTGADGRPNRAQIILKDGERGGRRYLQRSEETPPPAVRPAVIPPP